MSEWQPIETAPKDGTVVQIYIPSHRLFTIVSAAWMTVADQWVGSLNLDSLGGTSWSGAPTHWKPLPEPPK